ncbi:MAM and LDL-receptor class A domain-containing protein 1 [Nematostella vectensis]|uniref:MAM and LDL-receptor class A domain-containing protein 1 n=1 Tax=Nematostella vectensis TaxID=45351 RepID=UPI00139069AC|nr:MAM and LDL-receptor class A domain-containing protein 1 [Nematostella vectensis]XP_032241950.1 MAM and LDL-receptor class A domain-containing protein 1 [Nematostella vectensis]
MGLKWIFVLLGALALFYVTCAEEDTEIEAPENEELEAPARVRRQSACADKLSYCQNWPQSYCDQYKAYMDANCPKKCRVCSSPTVPPACADKSQHCAGWKASGYCKGHYEDYMKNNCFKTCGYCGGGGGSGSGSCSGNESNKLKACNFDVDTCDWYQVPFDDNGDFELKSGSGANGGSGGFLSASERGTYQLVLPLELVLPHTPNDKGKDMCLRFHYKGNDGKLKVYEVPNSKASNTEKMSIDVSGGAWKCGRVTVNVGLGNQLMIEASVSQSAIELDDVSFADGRC